LNLYGLFQENDIDVDALVLLQESDLKELGIKVGSRKKVNYFLFLFTPYLILSFFFLFFYSFFLSSFYNASQPSKQNENQKRNLMQKRKKYIK